MRRRFSGASLAALAKLGAARGYRFVGASAGVNAFFVLESEIPTGTLPPASVANVLEEPRLSGRQAPTRNEELLGYPWVHV
jgi:hypothetical protein